VFKGTWAKSATEEGLKLLRLSGRVRNLKSELSASAINAPNTNKKKIKIA